MVVIVSEESKDKEEGMRKSNFMGSPSHPAGVCAQDGGLRRAYSPDSISRSGPDAELWSWRRGRVCRPGNFHGPVIAVLLCQVDDPVGWFGTACFIGDLDG
jgi:hypothetical protein